MTNERDDLFSQISDASKDLHGFRPWIDPETSTEDLREMAADLYRQLEAEIQREAREEAEDAAVRAEIRGGAFLGPEPKSPFEGLL